MKRAGTDSRSPAADAHHTAARRRAPGGGARRSRAGRRGGCWGRRRRPGSPTPCPAPPARSAGSWSAATIKGQSQHRLAVLLVVGLPHSRRVSAAGSQATGLGGAPVTQDPRDASRQWVEAVCQTPGCPEADKPMRCSNTRQEERDARQAKPRKALTRGSEASTRPHWPDP